MQGRKPRSRRKLNLIWQEQAEPILHGYWQTKYWALIISRDEIKMRKRVVRVGGD